jgi:hypothetical protein
MKFSKMSEITQPTKGKGAATNAVAATSSGDTLTPTKSAGGGGATRAETVMVGNF